MTETTPDPERKMTPTERLHDIARAMAERPAPVSGQPHFTVQQTKATGGATVYEWEAHIPVCAEFPTAEDAFAAAVKYASTLREQFGASGHENGGEK